MSTRRKRCSRCGELTAPQELDNIEVTMDVTDDPSFAHKAVGITTRNGRRYLTYIDEADVCEGCRDESWGPEETEIEEYMRHVMARDD